MTALIERLKLKIFDFLIQKKGFRAGEFWKWKSRYLRRAKVGKHWFTPVGIIDRTTPRSPQRKGLWEMKSKRCILQCGAKE